MFNHFVDVVIVNCWLIYRRHNTIPHVPKNDQLSLIEYRFRLASLLAHSATPRRNNHDDDDNDDIESDFEENLDNATPRRKKRRAVVPLTSREMRFDGFGHLPQHMDEDKYHSKCRLPNCNGKTKIKCVKCKLYLCVNKNCFMSYHTR